MKSSRFGVWGKGPNLKIFLRKIVEKRLKKIYETLVNILLCGQLIFLFYLIIPIPVSIPLSKCDC